MNKYRKAIASVVAAVVIAVIPLMKSGPLTVTSELNIGVAFLSALLVYVVPNLRKAPAFKTGIAAVMAGVAFLITVVTSDCPALSQIIHCVALVNWLQCGLMVLKAAGVYIVPNDDPNG